VFFFHPPRKGDFLVAGFDLTQKENKIEFLDTLNSSTNTQISCNRRSMWDVEVSRSIVVLQSAVAELN
jgi:hypothetical protein